MPKRNYRINPICPKKYHSNAYLPSELEFKNSNKFKKILTKAV